MNICEPRTRFAKMDAVGPEQLDSDKGGGDACLQVLATWLERYWNRESSSWENGPIPLPWQLVAWKRFLLSSLLTDHRWFLCTVLEDLILVPPRTGWGQWWTQLCMDQTWKTRVSRDLKGALEVRADIEQWRNPCPHPFSQLIYPWLSIPFSSYLSLLSIPDKDTIPRPQNPVTSFMGQADNLTMNHTSFYEKGLSSSFCSLDMSNIICFKLKNQLQSHSSTFIYNHYRKFQKKIKKWRKSLRHCVLFNFI